MAVHFLFSNREANLQFRQYKSTVPFLEKKIKTSPGSTTSIHFTYIYLVARFPITALHRQSCPVRQIGWPPTPGTADVCWVMLFRPVSMRPEQEEDHNSGFWGLGLG